MLRRATRVCALAPSSCAPFEDGMAASATATSVQSPLAAAQLCVVVPVSVRARDVRAEAVAGGSDGGSHGGSNGGGGGGGGGGDGGKGDGEGEDRILTLSEVEAFAAEKKLSLPADMLEVAKKYGLRSSVLTAFAAAQGLFITGFLVRTMPYFRDRILADPLFLFKVGAEVVIDSGCATVAEVRKRGKDFWNEFEFYLSDLLVGLVLDVVLVSLMAPAAVLGGVSRAAMSSSPLAKWLATIPSAVFEASVPGVKTYGLGQRVACLGVKFLEYSLAGICCGLLGQGLANSLMLLKRHLHGEKEDDVPVPPLFKTALVWGLFMGVSSNTRYQIVFGLERLVDMTIARSIPQVAYGTTVAIRFVNNVIGGENFIDMARWAGVQ
ncbi:hypothetical protein GPECTOR_120g417 [Gonium pectorale]|uniref:Uncharacterized protein n=1 Tax=Gonium pectorale TaxID=33097 RepID=A0A150G0A3_GONPE|nr:hypothetical protein GPECTOR_120g417 [Gonium pectorale]|eukprot:KXZ42750.1 hypothetical protein GPECTOR_120g417 [Gonium pectorale]